MTEEQLNSINGAIDRNQEYYNPTGNVNEDYDMCAEDRDRMIDICVDLQRDLISSRAIAKEFQLLLRHINYDTGDSKEAIEINKLIDNALPWETQ